MLAWTDEDPSLQKIFETVTLYWMTDTVSRSFYHNRALANNDDDPKIARLGVVRTSSQRYPLNQILMRIHRSLLCRYCTFHLSRNHVAILCLPKKLYQYRAAGQRKPAIWFHSTTMNQVVTFR